MPKIVRRNSKPRAQIGDVYYYKQFGAKDHRMTILAESPTPGYKGFYDYFVRVDMPDGKITHSVIHGCDIFDPKSIYEKLEPKKR